MKMLMRNAALRHIVTLSALSLPLAALSAQNALASRDNFRVYNGSSVDLTNLYVSASGLDQWQDDILGANILPSNSSIQVVFGDPAPSQCLYDIRAVFANGQELEDYQVNVCSSSGYTFY